jgi:hypothetical protein
MADQDRFGLPDEPDDEGSEQGEVNGEREARRRHLIAVAQESWIAALTDLGGRNTLLYYKDRRAGTLDLGKADPEALAKFLRSGSIRLTRLFTDVDVRVDAIRRVQAIYRRATELLEERGIRAGYLATGLATWDELFLEPAAPVLLRGLTIVPTRARHDDFELVLDDDTEVNPVLLNKLATAFSAATGDAAITRPVAFSSGTNLGSIDGQRSRLPDWIPAFAAAGSGTMVSLTRSTFGALSPARPSEGSLRAA